MTGDGQPVPPDDTDLSGMAPTEAEQYVLAFVQALKETQKRKARFEAELELWEQRGTVAEKSGRQDLLQGAQKKEQDVREELAALDIEERDLKEKVSKLKRNLKNLAVRFDYSVDTSQIQASLDMLVGEEAKNEDDLLTRLKEEKANSDLEELKRRMGEDQR